MTSPTKEQLDAIYQYDTCSVANAIESFNMRLRHEGFPRPGLQWMCPSAGRILGFACTSRVKTSHPPPENHNYLDRTDWWEDLTPLPKPLIAVIEDVDDIPGFGSVAGEIHASILSRLGCTGLITNGAVRDIPALDAMGFGILACQKTPSHAYAHMVDHGFPVDIRGLRIHPGDLLFADQHGLIQIPLQLVPELPSVIERQLAKERRVIDLCRSASFSLEQLKAEVSL